MTRVRSVRVPALRAARLAMLGAALFVWGTPALAVLLVLALALTAGALVAPAVSWLVVLGAGVWFYGGLAILRGRGPARPIVPGVELTASEEPGVWWALEQAADALGTAAPGALRITVGDGVAALRGRGHVEVRVGLPWLTTDTAVLVTAVAHALAGELAGAGSRKALMLAERLRRARNLVEHWRFGRAWRPYAVTGERLRRRADARRAAAAAAVCADALGADALKAYLQTAGHHAGFSDYWAADVGPCLQDGFAPPILDGWARQRPTPTKTDHDRPPPPLVFDPRTLERRLLGVLFPDTADTLVELEWERLADAVWLPRLRRAVTRLRVPAFTPSTLVPTLRAGPPDDIAAGEWPQLVGAALTIALVDEAGWSASAPLGAPIEVRGDGVSLLPFGVCRSALDPGWDIDAWTDFTETAEICDLRIDPAAWSPPATAPWHSDAAVPPSPPRRLELARAPARVRSAAILAVGTLLGLPAGVALLLAAARAATPAGTAFMVLLGLATVATLAVWLRSRLGVLRATGAVTISSDRAVVEHPALLKEPFEIPRSAVRAIVIDAGDWSDRRRFPVGPTELVASGGLDGSDDVTWLWSRDAPMLVPLLGVGTELPNVALLVNDPLLAPRVRRVVMSGPIPGEALTGVLLAFTDPAAARAAFAPWGLTRPGRSSDAAHVHRGSTGRAANDAPPDVG